MKRAFWPLSVCSIALVATMLAPAAAGKDVDAVFKAFWDARTPQDAAKVVPDIVASGVSFDDAFRNALRGAAQVLSGNGQPDS